MDVQVAPIPPPPSRDQQQQQETERVAEPVRIPPQLVGESAGISSTGFVPPPLREVEVPQQVQREPVLVPQQVDLPSSSSEEVAQDISAVQQPQQPIRPSAGKPFRRPQEEELEQPVGSSEQQQQVQQDIIEPVKPQLTKQRWPSAPSRPSSSTKFQQKEREEDEPVRVPSSSSSSGISRPFRPRPAILQEPASDFFLKNFPDAAAPEGDDVPLDEQAAIREALFELKKETRSG